jgi:hypothetical protein
VASLNKIVLALRRPTFENIYAQDRGSRTWLIALRLYVGSITLQPELLRSASSYSSFVWLSCLGFGGNGLQVRDVLHIDGLYDLIVCQLNGLDEYSGELVQCRSRHGKQRVAS